MAHRVGPLGILLLPQADSNVTSRWTEPTLGWKYALRPPGGEEHDVAMELLLCFGQALLGTLSTNELQAYWTLLAHEILEEIAGEIDEQALEEKRSRPTSHSCSRWCEQLESYGRASFAGTAAEYVHCLWHDVTVRPGADDLPAPQLRRRLELLTQGSPPDRGYLLFPARAAPLECGPKSTEVHGIR